MRLSALMLLPGYPIIAVRLAEIADSPLKGLRKRTVPMAESLQRKLSANLRVHCMPLLGYPVIAVRLAEIADAPVRVPLERASVDPPVCLTPDSLGTSYGASSGYPKILPRSACQAVLPGPFPRSDRGSTPVAVDSGA